jgi:hypothetical protein
MGEFAGFPLEEKILQLWRSVPEDAEDKYADDWLEPSFGKLDAETGFLCVLAWGPHDVERQKAVWTKVKAAYEGVGKPLNKFSKEETERLAACYPLKKGWQGKFLRSMVLYLGNSGLPMKELAGKLKEAGAPAARAALQDILDTTSTKIIDCYLRDILLLNAFPVDRRVAETLKKYNIRPDPYAVLAMCEKMDIPPRIFARAVYDMQGK